MTGMPYSKLFGVFAVTAGLARIVMSFVPWREGDPLLEGAALAIDLGLLFGLTGFWATYARTLGPIGLAAYLISASGIALIAGPDGEAFGRDIYQTGVAVIGGGLALLSAVIIACGAPARLAAISWLLAVAATFGGSAVGKPGEGFMAAGVFFGLGFVLAGRTAIAGRSGPT